MGALTLGFMPLVSENNRNAWEDYSINQQGWAPEARTWETAQKKKTSSTTRLLRGAEASNEEENVFREFLGVNRDTASSKFSRRLSEEADFSSGISSRIFTVSPSGLPIVDEGSGPYAPIWQTSPAPLKLTSINYNLLSHPVFWDAIEVVLESKEAVVSKVLNYGFSHESFSGVATESISDDPISAMYYPVFSSFSENKTLVGLLGAELVWTYFFENTLPDSASGIICVVDNACGQQFTYRIDGENAAFLGVGDLHNPKFDHLVESRSIAYLSSVSETFAGVKIDFAHCPFTLNVYPSNDTQSVYQSFKPAIYASTIVGLFFIAVAIFVVYDNVHRRRQKADLQSIIVLERVFPQDAVRPTLRKRVLNKLHRRKKNGNKMMDKPFRASLSAFPSGLGEGKLKADPFSNATVMFADIAGWETWNTIKDPEQKGSLLETVHRSLNVVAKRHGIFQVEMAGDSFVAVTGVQDAEDDHAVIMAQFASECRKRMIELFKTMKVKELSMRFGVHSGHVQAGLYESENSRFQLFGDTVDTAHQMLTSGEPNKIHVSVETAELLNLAGKQSWIVSRKDLVLVKGKGEMSTFWIKPKACLSAPDPCKTDSSTDSSTTSDEFDDLDSWGSANVDQRPLGTPTDTNRLQHLIDWNFKVLLEYLKMVQARRHATRSRMGAARRAKEPDSDIGMGDPIIEEALEAVRMPPFDSRAAKAKIDPDLITIDPEVESQLRLYISSIASTHRDNAFHSFEHSTHVTMAVDKMLKRISLPDESLSQEAFDGKKSTVKTTAANLYNRTFGISSDPLAQFALVFSALVHDVDHVGVSNHQLVKEKSPIASLYKNKSVAEQNSVDIAWWLLMTPNFSDLRACIYSDAIELRRFRQLLVNSVVATDILDRDLKVHRDKGWARAFSRESIESVSEASMNHKATMTIEHLMQAADAAHTMQNFHVYLQWNEQHFEETYKAHNDGRADRDPSETWYIGELCFFDNFVIPLATKLRDSGVFGNLGGEYLQHALENRKQWEDKGRGIVKEMVDNFGRQVAANQEETISFM
jgi:class 3 adenylate cyclase